MKQLALILMLICFAIPIMSAPDTTKVSDSVVESLKILKQDVQELRRDQLNYSIEKNLLKEAYTSSYNTIQSTIVIILGVLALIGIAGLLQLRQISKEYKSELSNLRSMKSNYEGKLKRMLQKLGQMRMQVETIQQTNEDQNLKIKILELKEKALTYYNLKLYSRAIEYLDVALEIDTNSVDLHNIKRLCLMNSNRFAETATELEKIRLLADSSDVVSDLREAYLLSNNVLAFDAVEFNESYVIKPSVSNYLTSLRCFILGDIEHLKEIISKEISAFNEDSMSPVDIGNWSFSECLRYLSTKPNSQLKSIFLTYIAFLQNSNQNTMQALSEIMAS